MSRVIRSLAFAATTLLVGGAIILAKIALDARQAAHAQEEEFVGGIEEDRAAVARTPKPVRNDVAQPREEIVTLRYFKIHEGRFPEFYQASVEGVWPFFEKIGARVVGMWEVVHPEFDTGTAGEDSDEYDEVYLMTRYASLEHWRATRDMADHGGNGPDWEKAREALAFRRSMTYETHVTFLEGRLSANGPYYMPGLDEDYQRVE